MVGENLRYTFCDIACCSKSDSSLILIVKFVNTSFMMIGISAGKGWKKYLLNQLFLQDNCHWCDDNYLMASLERLRIQFGMKY